MDGFALEFGFELEGNLACTVLYLLLFISFIRRGEGVSKPSPCKVHITDPWVTGARQDFGLDWHLARCLEFGLDRLEYSTQAFKHFFLDSNNA